MLALWVEEADAPVGFYDANKMSSELRFSTPSLPKIIKTLKSHGFFAARTHFNPNAFKTDAEFEAIVQVLKDI
jgi:tRNA G26 N,N-dimethylase Trm1